MNVTVNRLLILVMTGFLSSCQSTGVTPEPILVAPRPAGIDGDWVDTRGINSARFAGGTFVSTDSQTGATMARGSYTFRDQKTVDLSFTSLIRKTTVNAACLLAGPAQLNCTTANGAQFSLVRRAATPLVTPVVAPALAPVPIPATQS